MDKTCNVMHEREWTAARRSKVTQKNNFLHLRWAEKHQTLRLQQHQVQLVSGKNKNLMLQWTQTEWNWTRKRPHNRLVSVWDNTQWRTERFSSYIKSYFSYHQLRLSVYSSMQKSCRHVMIWSDFTESLPGLFLQVGETCRSQWGELASQLKMTHNVPDG